MRALRVLAPLLAMLAAAPALAKGPTPLHTFKPDSALFIDDPFVVRDDGKALAYVTTDGANTAALHVAAIPPAGPETIVPNLPVDVWKVRFLGASDRVLVVARDPSTEVATAQVFTKTGPMKQKLGPAADIELGTVKGRPAILTFERRQKGAAAEQLVSAFDAQTLRPFGTRTLREDQEGRVALGRARFKILWWQDGYTTAAVLQAGDYDPKHDIRRPDHFALYQVFDGKLAGAREIGDVLGFAKSSLAHQKHENQAVFAHLSDDHRELLLTDGIEAHAITLVKPLPMYDAETLAYQPLGPARIALSFAIDPMNPQAQERRKAVPNDLDLYLVDRQTRKATLALSLPGDGRPATWRIGGDVAAVLHKSVGFDRGGVALEIYRLGDLETAGR